MLKRRSTLLDPGHGNLTVSDAIRATIVADVMTPDVRTVHPETPMKHAAKTMGDHGIRHVVVTDSFEKPIGVFSERDLLKHIAQCTARGELVPGRISVSELMVNRRSLSAYELG